MPRGSHRAGGRSRWPLVAGAVAVLAGGGAAAWIFLGGGNPLEPTPDFTFEFGKVGASALGDQAPEDEVRDAAEQVRETLDEMYTTGFIDRSRWDGGRFPDLVEVFAPGARQRVRNDLENLSLGGDAAKIESVDPITGRLTVRFLLGEGGEFVGATARAIFSANAVATDGGNVAIQHDGTYYLQPEDDEWLINAYDVRGIVTRVTQPLPDPNASPS